MQQEIITDLIREKMAQGTTFRFRVISGSMVPLIGVGDKVVVRTTRADRLRRGDVVLYAVDGTFHTHRLLARRRQGKATLLVTKGDASLTPDPPWREEQLLGKVTAISREHGTLDLEGRRWKTINGLLGLLAALQVVALQAGRRVKRVIIGNRRTRWGPLLARIVAAPSQWLVRLAELP